MKKRQHGNGSVAQRFLHSSFFILPSSFPAMAGIVIEYETAK
jgi:hypothetical protein